MSIQVRCEECGQGYRLKPELAGRVLPCRECGADMVVPGRPAGRSSGELRRGRSSAEFRARGSRPRGNRSGSKDSGIPTAVWIGGGVGLALLLVVLGIFLWMRHSKNTQAGDVANASDNAAKELEPNTWKARPEGTENLGEEIALGPYSIRAPKGWMLVSSTYGGGHGTLEWKWPDESLKAKLTFSVKLDRHSVRGEEPNIITEPGQHNLSSSRHTYIYTGADRPETGRIDGVDFHRVNFPEVIRGQPNTHEEYIAILDGAKVQITTDVLLPREMKLCAHAEAAALSFKEKATVPALLTLDEMRDPPRRHLKGFPKPRLVTEKLEDWGFRPKPRPFRDPEFALLVSDDDAETAIVSTPRPNYIAVKGVVYSLLEKGKIVERFTIPAELEKLKYKALSDDGKIMAFADQSFSRKDGKIHLLSEGGKVWKHIQESQTRSTGYIRLDFIRFLPNNHLVAGWRFRDEEVDIYNLTTGEQKRFPVKTATAGAVAVSRDGRFLASIDEKTDKPLLTLIDTPEHKTALAPPPGASFFFFNRPSGLQFSPDGKELAGIVSGQLLCWSINGDLVEDSKPPVEWTSFYDDDGPALQWADDGSGWFVYGRYLVDRNESQLRWSIPKPATRVHPYIYNRILDDGRILLGQGDDDTPYSFAVYPKQ